MSTTTGSALRASIEDFLNRHLTRTIVTVELPERGADGLFKLPEAPSYKHTSDDGPVAIVGPEVVSIREKLMAPQGVQAGQACRFKFPDPAEDIAARSAHAENMAHAFGFTINAMRHKFGLPPLEEVGGIGGGNGAVYECDLLPGVLAAEPPPAIPTVFQDFGKEPTAKPALAGLTREWPMPGTAGASLASARMQEGWGE